MLVMLIRSGDPEVTDELKAWAHDTFPWSTGRSDRVRAISVESGRVEPGRVMADVYRDPYVVVGNELVSDWVRIDGRELRTLMAALGAG